LAGAKSSRHSQPSPDQYHLVSDTILPPPLFFTRRRQLHRRDKELPCTAPVPSSAATPSATIRPRRAKSRTRPDPSWRYRALATGHDSVITQPGALTQLLLELAQPPALVSR
jgi:hypothetical protein